ncbi:MAG: ribulose bisphosphate carboxylase small subunit [Gammaproteobacteria bacterium]|nr:ribulose bisphosphate carboxylase small subunit [Gammaproteobacteria bacterium]
MQNQNNAQKESSLAASKETLSTISNCLKKGCVVCIEHCPDYSSNYAFWQKWGSPSCYNGDELFIYNQVDQCCDSNPDDFVRLNIADTSTYSKFILMVQSPAKDSRSSQANDIT